MKNVFILLTPFLISVNAFAKSVPTSSFSTYKEAVRMDLSQETLPCEITDGVQKGEQLNLSPTVIDDATFAEVDSNGSQPLLIFTKQDKVEKKVVSITTSPDYKRIVSVEYDFYSVTIVNSGNLQVPDITKKYILVDKGICRIGAR